MPTFIPRSAQEAAAQWLARVIARTALTDAAQGSVISGIAGAIGDEVEAMEGAINKLKRSHWLDASGDLLDERLGDMPTGFQGRLGATAASTASIVLELVSSVSPTIIPGGTIYGRSDNPSVQYLQVSDVTVAAGQTSYPGPLDPPVRVVATQVGTIGNCTQGQINLVQTPVNGLLSVINAASVGGGTNRETDDQVRARARAYVQSLAGATPAGLLYAALTYQTAQGIRMRHATIWEDPARPGYSELLIDDGTGLAGWQRAGVTATGVVGTSGITVLYHEQPAVDPISSAQFLINGGPAPLGPLGQPQYVSVEERGVLYPVASLLQPGDAWQISGYQVFTGPVAEIQGLVEGDVNQWWSAFGKRPSGGRVKVRPPNVVPFDLAAVLRIRTGADLLSVQALVTAELDAYLADVPPGAPFRGSVFYQRVLDNVPDVLSMIITDPASVDKYPPDQRTRFVRGNVSLS